MNSELARSNVHLLRERSDRRKWQFLALGDFCDLKLGKSFKKSELGTSGYPVWSGYGVIGFGSDYMFDESVLTITCRGSGTGKVYMTPPKCCLTKQAISISPREGFEVDKYFLFWALKASNRRQLITGSVQELITVRDLATHLVPIPPIDEQQAIVSSLGGLTDKIELNDRMNATLESQVQAIFQSWFVDFDPVWRNRRTLECKTRVEDASEVRDANWTMHDLSLIHISEPTRPY